VDLAYIHIDIKPFSIPLLDVDKLGEDIEILISVLKVHLNENISFVFGRVVHSVLVGVHIQKILKENLP